MPPALRRVELHTVVGGEVAQRRFRPSVYNFFMCAIHHWGDGTLSTQGCQLKRTGVRGTTRTMPTPDARLRQLRMRRFLTAVQAAAYFGWNPNTYKSHENGIRPISKKAAEKYARGYNVSVGWLLFGEGAPPITSDNIGKNNLAVRHIPRLDWDVVGTLIAMKDALAAATEYYVARSDDNFGPLTFALTVKDESMQNTNAFAVVSFQPGDEILLDPERSVSPGDFVLARISNRNETVFRQYRETGFDKQGRKVVTLHSLNPNYADVQIVLGVTGEIIARLVRHSRNW